MREYARVRPVFWTQGTGKQLKGDREAREMALYLMSAPGSHMLGIYYLTLPTLAHELGYDSTDKASKVLRRVCESGFAEYDEATEHIWVPNMAREQIGESLKPKDKRVAGIVSELKKLKRHRFVGLFLREYADCFSLREHFTDDDLQAPYKPHRSQEQEQEQEQEKEIEKGAPPESISSPPKKRDPLAEQLAGKTARTNPDVIEIHEAFKVAIEQPNRSLRGGSLDAETIRDCLKAHGKRNCLIVAKTCMSDGMVNGSTDPNGRDHKSVAYVFGNESAFNRILGDAFARAKKKRNSKVDIMDEALELEGDRSKAYRPERDQ